MTFSRWDETPLYQQLARTLRRKIKTGEIPPATQLPTEHQLATDYHLSRDTVRKALRLLREEGLIRKYKGRGSFVPPTREDPPT